MARKKNEATVTVNTVSTEIPENVKVVTGYADPMRDAIIIACESGNKKAITAENAAFAGIPQKDFDRWRTYVNGLRECAIEYGKISERKNATTEELALAKGRVFEKWEQILTVGEADKFHPNMFIREHDADTVRVYATGIATVNVPGVGTVGTVTPANIFRRLVETLLGLRIRANEILCDDDRNLIANYLSWENAVKTGNERLNGYDDEEGRHVDGLLDKKANNEKSYKNSIAMLASFGIDEKTALENDAVASLVAVGDMLEKQITDTQKTIKKAQESIDKKKDQYNRVIASINRIEAPAMK